MLEKKKKVHPISQKIAIKFSIVKAYKYDKYCKIFSFYITGMGILSINLSEYKT